MQKIESWQRQVALLTCCKASRHPVYHRHGAGGPAREQEAIHVSKNTSLISKDTKKLFDVKPHLKLKITEFALLRSWDPFSLGISTAELVRLFLSCQILFSSRSTSLCALRPSGSGMGSCLLLLPQWMREQPARFCHWTLPPPHVADNDNAETCASCERTAGSKIRFFSHWYV